MRSDIYLITCILKNSVVKVLLWWFSDSEGLYYMKKMIECLPSLNNFGKTSVLFSHLHKENENKIGLGGRVYLSFGKKVYCIKMIIIYVI
jgi:hypothetical protein